MNKFIERLKQLRTEKNLSQAQLAKEIDVTQPAIAYWETGKKIPSAQAIITLAQYFGVSTDYLLGLED
ncbi:MAG: helix-turn-helix transcriptional regulator [Clostridia bacterium]|nr:helix-turn-helix transcriptional regulator [Clostridia bacterium]